MRLHLHARSWILSLSIPLFGAAAVPAVAEEGAFKELRSFPVKDQGHLTVRTDIGSFEVVGGAPGEVRVEMAHRGDGPSMERFLKAVEFHFAQEGEEVRFEVRVKPGSSLRDPFLARYRVTVPSKFDADLETSGGNISVQKLTGSVRVETSGGNLTLSHLEGPLTATASGGNISLEETVGGIKASASGGGITARLSERPHQDVQLSTSGGNLTVYLAPGVAVDLDATAHGGSVSAASGLRRGLRGNDDETDLVGEINGGGPKMVLRTSGGNIDVEEGA